jgi:hypothetical protein
MEHLGRGIIAVKTDKGYFLSWRLLGTVDAITKLIKIPVDIKFTDP